MGKITDLIVGVAVLAALIGSALGIGAISDYAEGLRGGFPWWALFLVSATAAAAITYFVVPTGAVDAAGRRVRL